jgi:hypothetical protein
LGGIRTCHTPCLRGLPTAAGNCFPWQRPHHACPPH